MLELTIENTQKITVVLNPMIDETTPGTVDGAPVWSIVSGGATFLASDNGLSVSLISADVAEDTVFKVVADVDLGSGVKELSDTITLHTVLPASPQVTSLGLVAGQPEPKNPPTARRR